MPDKVGNVEVGGRRVVVRFRPEIHLPYSSAAADHLKERTGHAWSELTENFPGIRLEPYFASIGIATLRKFERLRPAFGTEPFSFTSFYIIEHAANFDRKKLVAELKKWKAVDTAYVEPGLAKAPSGVDPLNVDQKYQDPAVTGIGSREFVLSTGIAGQGIGFVDVEQGWVLDHEDLVDAHINLIWGENRNEKDHGTAVLGIVVATANNPVGGTGIAPAAQASVVSVLKPEALDIAYTAEAILHAACAMLPGDVMLLELQRREPTDPPQLVPVEADLAIFHVIRAICSLGITVVEAGVNGGVDLDAFRDADGKFVFNTGHADFRDSGAILVGAANSVDRSRECTSNFGSRLDCFAWGDCIRTSTSSDGVKTNEYTAIFGQTSGASAIVAGAAILLQSWQIANGPGAFSVKYLRELLSNSDINTKSKDPINDRIGRMPDLNAIITFLAETGGTG
jgi:hypothetical protein